MCGIIGMASSKGTVGYLQRKKFIHNGLYADALRGFHSTGLLMVPSNAQEDIVIHKKAMPAGDFLDTKAVDSLIADVDKYQYIIGHNRHATKGGITSRMAHPFNHGNISLVHNGTLNTQYYLPKGSSFTSDSEAITYALNEQGSDETIKDLDGAFALVWHDDEDDTLHMVRNDERPMSFAFVENEDTMLFASERRMLDWIAIRNGIRLEKIYNLNTGFEAIFTAGALRDYASKKHKLKIPYSYYGNNYSSKNGVHKNQVPAKKKPIAAKENLNDIFAAYDLKPKSEYDICVEKFTAFNPSQSTGDIYGYLEGTLSGLDKEHRIKITGINKEDWAWVLEEDKENRFLSAVLTKSAQMDNGIPIFTAITPDISNKNQYMRTSTKQAEGDAEELEDDITPLFQGPHGLIKEEELINLLSDGCSNCSGVIFVDEHEETRWTVTDAPICPHCAKDDNLGITLH